MTLTRPGGRKIKEAGQRPPLELLRACLGDKHLLLLLDNVEQVTEAAPAITNLLQSCPDLKVLVSSREWLHPSAEHEYLVPPLKLPGADRPTNPDALSRLNNARAGICYSTDRQPGVFCQPRLWSCLGRIDREGSQEQPSSRHPF